MLLLHIYQTIATSPPYAFDFTTSTLTISKCVNDKVNCTIDKESFRKSGPYQSYVIVEIEFGSKKIGNSVFDECTSLEKIIIPASISSIAYPFARSCKNLKKITVSNQSINFESDYYGCLYTFGKDTLIKAPPAIKELMLYDNTKRIIQYTFQLAAYDFLFLPCTIEVIEDCAFADSFIKTVEFSKDSIITSIYCFYICKVPYGSHKIIRNMHLD